MNICSLEVNLMLWFMLLFSLWIGVKVILMIISSLVISSLTLALAHLRSFLPNKAISLCMAFSTTMPAIDIWIRLAASWVRSIGASARMLVEAAFFVEFSISSLSSKKTFCIRGSGSWFCGTAYIDHSDLSMPA